MICHRLQQIGLLRRAQEWWARLPFLPVVWPGLGPQVDWSRNWPELIVIAIGLLAAGRNAPGTIQVSLLICGLGVWWLGVVLGWGRVIRVWMGLFGSWLITLVGSGLSSVWLPSTVAWAWAAMRWRRPLYTAVASVTLALTLLGEDAGLTMSTLLVSVLFMGAVSLRWQRTYPYVSLQPQKATLAGIIGVLGIGVATVKLAMLLTANQAQVGNLSRGLATWAAMGGLVLLGQVLDRLLQWAVAHLRSPRMYVPAVASWAAAWWFLASLWLLVVVLLSNLSGALQHESEVGIVRLSDLILSRQLVTPGLFRSRGAWIAISLSALALVGVLILMIEDRRRRRNQLHTSAVYADGILRPASRLGLPDGTPVYVVFEELSRERGVAPELKEAIEPDQVVAQSTTSPAALVSPSQSVPAGEECTQPAQPVGVSSSSATALLPSSPWQLPAFQAAFFLLFALTVGVVLFLRFYQLDSLQREIYGDIMIVRNYVTNVLAGRWPTRFDLSAGPLYHYLIAPIVALVGQDYSGLKVASVLVSLLALAATYLLARELVDDFFALLTMYIAGVSSWLLVFSRLGNSQILLPVLTAASLWLAVRALKYGRRADLVASAVVSALGLYVYPQSFVLPAVVLLTLLLMRWAGFSLRLREFGLFVIVVLFCAIPFFFILRADPANFTAGYIGSKIRAEGDFWTLLGNNILKALMAFHVRGDEGFRSNPVGLPHLDWISGILFFIGIGYWLFSKDRRPYIVLLLVPFLLLQVPSIMALNQPREVPSASRTLGIAPVVYLLVASGAWWLIQELRKRARHMAVPALVATFLLGGILVLNVDRYFNRYINGLPYQDTPIGGLIADYANSLPGDTQVHMVGCCWVYSIPDRFVHKEVVRPENWHYVEPSQLSCLMLQHMQLPAVFIWSFRDPIPAPQLESCRHWLPAQLYTYKDRPIFYAAPLRPDLPPLASDVEGAAQSSARLEVASVEVDGQRVDLLYSKLDMGAPGDIFDGNVATLARGLEDNPFILDFVFAEPRSIRGLIADFANMDFVVTARLYVELDSTPQVYRQEYRGLPGDPHIEMDFETPPDTVRRLRLEILQLNPPLDVHIHVRELKFK